MHVYRCPEGSTSGRKWHQTLFSQVPPFMAINIMLYYRFQGSSCICVKYVPCIELSDHVLRLFCCHSFFFYHTTYWVNLIIQIKYVYFVIHFRKVF